MKRNPAQIAEEILVLDAQGGDREALGEIFTLCKPAIMRHISRLTGARTSAQDIWQESVMAAIKGLRSLNDPALFRPWMYRITTFKCRDWQRKQYRLQATETELNESELSAPQVAATDTPDRVRAAMKLLDGEQQQILYLFYKEGLTLKEIAVALAIKPGAVKTRLFRARETFRKHWTGENHE